MADTYDDDDGFVGYVESTVDPGPWLNVATALFCVVSIVLFPCMVAVGRSYEKRRMRISTGRDENEGESEVQDQEVGVEAPVESRKDRTAKSQGRTISNRNVKSFTSRSLEDEREANSYQTKQKSEPLSDGAPSSFVRGNVFTGPPGAPICDSMTTLQLQRLIDRLVMPLYPDDAGADIDIARRKAPDLTSPDGDNLDNKIPTLLDTGASRRNRHAGARRYQRGLKDRMWQKEQERERRLSLLFRDAQSDACAEYNSFTRAARLQSLQDMGLADMNLSHEHSPVPSDADLDKSDRSSRNYLRRNSRGLCRWASGESDSDGKISSFEISPADAVDADDPGVVPLEQVSMEGDEFDLCCGAHAWWRPVTMASSFGRILDIAEWDRETKRILNLSIPFSLAALASGLFEVVRVGLVANFIGTDAVAAYTIVLLVLGLTQEFFGGFALTSASLCSQAVGRGNGKLAGEYVQIGSILYTICFIPNVVVWLFFTDDVVRLFGFNETTVQMAQGFARYFVIGQLFKGFNEAYGSLVAVIEHERFIACLNVCSALFSTCIILAALLTPGPTTLSVVGIIEMSTEVLFFGINLVLTNLFGWMKEYTQGLFRTNALRNRVAVKTVWRTAVPLALGQVLQYGEWEILTIFIAALGPAEVTTWGIVGSIWDTLEALTEGFGDAGEIRVSYHLGAGHPARARLSSYKSILVSVVLATIVTSIMWMIGENLATWLTPDPTLQRLIIEVLPLMGIGNIALTAGSVSWALVGAQGRYRLATFVAFVGSWCVTLPLAAIFTFGLNIDLQGVTSAVVVGYSFTGTSLLYILVRSDWQRLSRRIVDLNEVGGSFSSASSSSSSSDDDGNEPASY